MADREGGQIDTLPSQLYGVDALGIARKISVDSSGRVIISGGGGNPSSPDTSVQFNNGGAFGGDAAFFWDNTNKILGIRATSLTATHLQLGDLIFPSGTWAFGVAGRSYFGSDISSGGIISASTAFRGNSFRDDGGGVINFVDFGVNYTTLSLNTTTQTTTFGGNADFNTYKAIAMSCDNGATLPATAAIGQWFLINTTGRKILLQYNGTSWTSIIALGATTYYVSTTGTDDQAHGTGTGTDAFLTIQYAIDQIPPLFAGNIVINVGAGTFVGSVAIQGKVPTGSYTLSVAGVYMNTTTPLVNSTATSYARGLASGSAGGPTPAVLTDTGKFAGLNLRGKYVQYGGTGNYWVIESNTDDALTICDNSIASATTYKVFALATIMSSSTSSNLLTIANGQTSIDFRNISVEYSGAASMASINPFSIIAIVNSNFINTGSGGTGIFNTAGRLTITRSYASSSTVSGNVMRLDGPCAVNCPSSVFYTTASNGGCVFYNNLARTAHGSQITMYVGNSSSLQNGAILSGCSAVVTSNCYYKDLEAGIIADSSSAPTTISANTITFSNCTTDINKVLEITNNTLNTYTIGRVLKNTYGHDAASDYNYELLAVAKRIGDQTTNYTEFETTGFQELVGSAIAYEDLQVSINNLAKGATAPTDRFYAHGVGSGIAYPVLGFAKTNYVWFDIQTAHAMKLNTVLDCHIHFVLPNTTTIGHKIVWQLDVLYADISGTWTVPAGSPYTATHTVAANDDTKHRVLKVADIPAVNTGVSTIYKCKLTRIDGTATEYASEAYLEFVDCHYQRDTHGSRNETAK